MLNSLQIAVSPPVWSGFLSADLSGKINSLLIRAHEFGFSNNIHTVEEIGKEADETLFLKMKCKQHCLNPTLPPLKPKTHGLRPTGHSYELTECRLQLQNNSCIIRCLYIYV